MRIRGALLIELPKAFYCLLDNSLVTKLNASCFDCNLFGFYKTSTSLKGSKKLKVMVLTALILAPYMIFHKVPYYALCVLTFILTMLTTSYYTTLPSN